MASGSLCSQQLVYKRGKSQDTWFQVDHSTATDSGWRGNGNSKVLHLKHDLSSPGKGQRYYVVVQVATALLVAVSTLTFWIPPFASTSSYSSIFQSAMLLV